MDHQISDPLKHTGFLDTVETLSSRWSRGPTTEMVVQIPANPQYGVPTRFAGPARGGECR